MKNHNPLVPEELWKQPNESWDEKRARQLKLAEFEGILLDYPEYSDDEKYIRRRHSMKILKDDTIPYYLRIREAIRRHLEGRTDMNFLGVAIRVNYEMRAALNEQLYLNTNYIPRGFVEREESDDDTLREGDINAVGHYYVPYFRKFYPWEEFQYVKRIGRLKNEWNRTTLKLGKEYGDVAAFRAKKLVDGYALSLINKYFLDESIFLSKLTVGYVARRKPIPAKKIVIVEVDPIEVDVAPIEVVIEPIEVKLSLFQKFLNLFK